MQFPILYLKICEFSMSFYQQYKSTTIKTFLSVLICFVKLFFAGLWSPYKVSSTILCDMGNWRTQSHLATIKLFWLTRILFPSTISLTVTFGLLMTLYPGMGELTEVFDWWNEGNVLQVMEDTDKQYLLEEDLSSRVQSLIARLYRMTQQVQAVWEIGIISSFLIMNFVFDGTDYCHRIPLFCVPKWWAKLRHVVNGRGFCNTWSCMIFKLVLMSWITEILMAAQEV